MSKKVMQLCLSNSWGGLEMSAVNYARLLNANSIESFCLTVADSPLEKKARSHSIGVETFPAKVSWLSKVQAIRSIVKSRQVQTVFVHRLKDLGLLYPALIGMKDVRVIGFAHMLLKVSKRDPLHALLYSRLETLVTFTDRQRDLLKPRLPLPNEKYLTAYPGVDHQRFNPSKRDDELRRSVGSSSEDCLIGVIGRFDRQKGQLEFLRRRRQ